MQRWGVYQPLQRVVYLGGEGTYLQRVGTMSRVLEEAIVRIEELVGQFEEELACKATTVHPTRGGGGGRRGGGGGGEGGEEEGREGEEEGREGEEEEGREEGREEEETLQHSFPSLSTITHPSSATHDTLHFWLFRVCGDCRMSTLNASAKT